MSRRCSWMRGRWWLREKGITFRQIWMWISKRRVRRIMKRSGGGKMMGMINKGDRKDQWGQRLRTHVVIIEDSHLWMPSQYRTHNRSRFNQPVDNNTNRWYYLSSQANHSITSSHQQHQWKNNTTIFQQSSQGKSAP